MRLVSGMPPGPASDMPNRRRTVRSTEMVVWRRIRSNTGSMTWEAMPRAWATWASSTKGPGMGQPVTQQGEPGQM